MSKKINVKRIGETNTNNHGSKMAIIYYQNSINVTVKFEDGYMTKCTYQQFLKGNVSNPNDRTVKGVGFVGEGIFSSKTHPQIYAVWSSMLDRCYNDRYPTYAECTVCTEWHSFQNFCKWYLGNYYIVSTGERMEVDKDIKIKGNKIYSPETCLLVPRSINVLFTKSDAKRTAVHPIGVLCIDGNRYIARLNITIDGVKTKRYLGTFNTIDEAFAAYKEGKEQYIKEMANKYKDEIPAKLYEALINYKVAVND